MSVKKSLIRFAVVRLARFFAGHPKAMIIATVLYLLSPIDLAPEAMLGPLGMIDDLIVVILPMMIRGYARHFEQHDASPGERHRRDYYDTTAR